MNEYRGILDLRSAEPVGVVVTQGIKSPGKGFPIEKDRFHLVLPREAQGVRAHHPAFAPFNTAAPDKRKYLRGMIVHAHEQDCLEWHLKAQILDRAHPQRRPACVGDGVHATRWMGGDAENFREIDCPHELCEYRRPGPKGNIPCKPWMRFLFQLRWPDGNPLPTPLAKFTSGSWYTVANFRGFFASLYGAARELGVSDPSLYGFPFGLTLVERTQPDRKTRFPTVVISAEMEPAAFFFWQRKRLAELQAPLAYEALPEPPQQDPDLVYEDVRTISGPHDLEAQQRG